MGHPVVTDNWFNSGERDSVTLARSKCQCIRIVVLPRRDEGSARGFYCSCQDVTFCSGESPVSGDDQHAQRLEMAKTAHPLQLIVIQVEQHQRWQVEAVRHPADEVVLQRQQIH